MLAVGAEGFFLPTTLIFTMKILKAGKLKEKLLGECPGCDCEIEFTTTEAVHQSEQSEPGFFHRCPTVGCGELIQGFRIYEDGRMDCPPGKGGPKA